MKLIDVSTRLGWPLYLLLGVLAASSLWVLIAPDQAWRVRRAFVGWQYRDGHQIELSTAGRLWTRFTVAAPLAVAIWLGVISVNWSADSRVATEQWPYLGTVYYLGEAVESPGCTVRVIACLKSDVVFPIEVTHYQAFQSAADAPAESAVLDALPDDTNLLLYVEDRFFPTHLVLSEETDRVAVSLYGKCAPRYSWDGAYGSSPSQCVSHAWPSSGTSGVVPVSLGHPLGGRTLVDGNRGEPVERGAAD